MDIQQIAHWIGPGLADFLSIYISCPTVLPASGNIDSQSVQGIGLPLKCGAGKPINIHPYPGEDTVDVTRIVEASPLLPS